jgi:hypothetical protein
MAGETVNPPSPADAGALTSAGPPKAIAKTTTNIVDARVRAAISTSPSRFPGLKGTAEGIRPTVCRKTRRFPAAPLSRHSRRTALQKNLTLAASGATSRPRYILVRHGVKN